MLVGEFIKVKRIELGMSRQEFARKTKLGYNLITMIENGHRKLTKNKLPIVAEVLQIDKEELAEHNFKENWLQHKKNKIKEQIRKIDYRLISMEEEKNFCLQEKKLLEKQLKEIEKIEISLKEKEV